VSKLSVMRACLVPVTVAVVVILAPIGFTQAQSGVVKAPRKIEDAQPVYPERALSRGDEGYVVVELNVDSSGFVVNARVLGSTCAGLNDAALTATRKWQFEQLLTNGVAMPFKVTTQVPFRLPEEFKSRAGRPGSCRWTEPRKPFY